METGVWGRVRIRDVVVCVGFDDDEVDNGVSVKEPYMLLRDVISSSRSCGIVVSGEVDMLNGRPRANDFTIQIFSR